MAGTSALMLACSSNADNMDFIKELKKYELQLVDSAGLNAVDFATAAGREDVVAFLK